MTLPSGPTLRRRQAGPRRACPRATVRPSALTLACGSRCPTSPPTTASTHPTSRRPRRDLRGSRPRTSAAKWRLRRRLGASHQRALRRPARSCGRRPRGRLAIAAHEGRRRRGRRPCPTLSLPCAGAGRRQTRFVRFLLLSHPPPLPPPPSRAGGGGRHGRGVGSFPPPPPPPPSPPSLPSLSPALCPPFAMWPTCVSPWPRSPS